jgi:hypothetical protein
MILLSTSDVQVVEKGMAKVGKKQPLGVVKRSNMA